MPLHSIDLRDDLGHPVELPRPPRRVLSLVPSLTEAVADTGLLVGAMDWCTHPTDLEVAPVRGTKNFGRGPSEDGADPGAVPE
jgi:ABC-type Fe3+-hydroxamate transport system substrate-binding protein